MSKFQVYHLALLLTEGDYSWILVCLYSYYEIVKNFSFLLSHTH